MSGIAIIRPLPIAAIAVSSGDASKANMLTPSPREIWVSGNSISQTIDIDLGAAVPYDTVYIGGFNAGAGATWSLNRATGLGVGMTAEAAGNIIAADAVGPTYQALLRRGSAAAGRYLRIALTVPAAQIMQIGVVAVGLSWEHPYAYGAGRQLIDLSRVTELQDGGYGIEQGALKAGFQWRFIDLSKTRRDELWAIVRDRGTRKPVIVVEDIDDAPLPDASLHYGLFQKFEPWERANEVDTIWALSMQEWR